MINTQIYKEEDLCKIFWEANNKKTPFELIKDENFHVKYFRSYLGKSGLNAKFYYLEKDYISVDYLTDYSYYYSKSFDRYGNKCVRLHFFTFSNNEKNIFDETLKKAILNDEKHKPDVKDFWETNYLGFIVIRPIPMFFIGYTILRHYNYNKLNANYNVDRIFWGVKSYPVHFLGTKISIESLAFMSQDSNVAACATMAVWSVMQRAVENYFINLKSPYEITKDAGITVNDGNRIIPNTGLDLVSICHAITKNNLVTEIRYFENKENANYLLKKLVNAYSTLKLPLILGIDIPHDNKLEGHAVAICGHSINEANTNEIKTTQKLVKSIKSFFQTEKPLLKFKSDIISKLYTHDDQWGPFATYSLKNNDTVDTSWNLHTEESMQGKSLALIIPVFPKIRIPFEDIEELTIGINKVILKEFGFEIKENLEWDIQLHFSADFKSEVKQNESVNVSKNDEALIKFLEAPMPKYIWVTTLYLGKYKLMNFIYDATGLRRTNCLLASYSYELVFTELFINRLKDLAGKFQIGNYSRSQLEFYFRDSIEGFIDKINSYYSY